MMMGDKHRSDAVEAEPGKDELAGDAIAAIDDIGRVADDDRGRRGRAIGLRRGAAGRAEQDQPGSSVVGGGGI